MEQREGFRQSAVGRSPAAEHGRGPGHRLLRCRRATRRGSPRSGAVWGSCSCHTLRPGRSSPCVESSCLRGSRSIRRSQQSPSNAVYWSPSQTSSSASPQAALALAHWRGVMRYRLPGQPADKLAHERGGRLPAQPGRDDGAISNGPWIQLRGRQQALDRGAIIAKADQG